MCAHSIAMTLAIALLLFTEHAVAAVYDRWTERLHGKIKADGIDYFDFKVDDEIKSVSIVVADAVRIDEAGASQESTLVLLLRYGAFPTEANYDQRLDLNEGANTSTIIDQLRSGRYYASLRGGLPFDSEPAFVASHTQLHYSVTITYLACALYAPTNSSANDDGCDASTMRSIAPPYAAHTQDTAALSEHFKDTSRVYDGCVDVAKPTLTYIFNIPHPQWSLTMLLSTTFSSGLKISALSQYHIHTEASRKRSDIVYQSSSMPAGAGFRSTLLRFTAPSTGLWTITVSGDLENNSMCLANGGAAFALELAHDSTNCSAISSLSTASSDGAESEAAGIDNCSLLFHRLEQERRSSGDNSELDAVFSSSALIRQDDDASGRFTAAFTVNVDRQLAGANLKLRVEATTNIPRFHVLARVNAYPTLAQYDYRFASDDASSIGSVNRTDTTKHTTLEMASFVWTPVRYPITGDWFLIAIAEDDNTSTGSTPRALNLTMQSFGCDPENACSGHGKCHVDMSSHGIPYSMCNCDYGHAGDRCEQVSVDRTYRGTQIFFAMASNLAIVPATWLCFRRKLYAEGLLFLVTGLTSTLYHACDYDLFCALRYSDLHHLDFALAFNNAAVLVVHLSGARDQIKAGLLVFYLLAMLVITIDAGESLIAWVIFAGILLIQFAMCIAYYIVVGTARMGLGKSVALRSFLFCSRNFDKRYAIAGVLFIIAALCCWFLASSSNYWIVHSAWHVNAMLGLFCLMSTRLNDRYQLLAPGIGIDVLGTPPQFRFAVSSVKSVDILEDTSENEAYHGWR